MDRTEVLRWFEEHPAAAHGDVEQIVTRCERAVRRHAAEDAWLAAKQYVERRAETWHEEWSPPASEAFVTPEVCHQLAWELRRHEPEVAEADTDHLAGGPVMDALEPDGWTFLRRWVRELAADEEHRIWQEIVRFTDRRGRSLARERKLSQDWRWDAEHRYTVIAAHVAEILAHDYSIHAHPR
jgi:hypothetical protein